MLYWISLPWATFGIVTRDVYVAEAAPIARWAVGKHIDLVYSYYQSKGATICALYDPLHPPHEEVSMIHCP